MRFIKPRKPRGIKKSGYLSVDMCPYRYAIYCDPGSDSDHWRRKKSKRFAAKVCIACGQYPCRCKSKLKIKQPIMVVEKKKKSKTL